MIIKVEILKFRTSKKVVIKLLLVDGDLSSEYPTELKG